MYTRLRKFGLNSKLLLSLLTISCQLIFGASNYPVSAQDQGQRITHFEIDKGECPTGPLYITYKGKRKKIANAAIDAWIINDGKEIVYSDPEGAGGYKNEGNGLTIYEAASNFTRKIMADYFPIYALREFTISNGKRLLMVRGHHGGSGDSQFAVVDPERGEIFYRKYAELIAISEDKITLGFFYGAEFECTGEARDRCNRRDKEESDPNKLILSTSAKPFKKETHDLKEILKNPVIYNEKDMRLFENKRSRLKKTLVYMWRVNEDILAALPRYVNPKAPLKPTLEALFSKPPDYEQELGYSSSTFGMKFEGVVLKNGTATVRFSQPPNETNYGTSGPFIFYEAIRKTARQFPSVNKVEICAIGKTLIDQELSEDFPKCDGNLPLDDVVPIVESSMLLGGSRRGKWITAEHAARALRNGYEFISIDIAHANTGKKIVAKKGEEWGACPETTILEFDKEYDSQTMLGFSNDWNPIPRRPRKIDLSERRYKKLVKSFLKTKGLQKTKIVLTEGFEIDLDGDGSEEIILGARYFKKGLLEAQSVGDYSFVLVLKKQAGEIENILLEGDFFSVEGESSPPNEHTVSSIADLNGDGEMEIIITSSYYEGQWATVYKIGNTKAIVVFRAECIV